MALRDYSRIAGNLLPEVPTMDSFPTLPRRRKSKRVKPTTPTFLSDPEAPPPTKPVVYSPVPTINTFNGAILTVVVLFSAGAVWSDLRGVWRGAEG